MSQSHSLSRIAWSFCLAVFAAAAVSPARSAEDLPRVVTIGGAATEIVWALGAGDAVVAVDLSSTYPPEVRQLPQVGYVRSISPEGVLSMEPGLVVATGALGPPAARRMMERLEVPTIWLPDPDEVEDFRRSVRAVADELGREEKAEALLEEVEARLAEAAQRASRWSGEEPAVLFLLEPPGASSGGMAAGAGTRAEELIRLAGGRNVVDSFSGFQPISRESLLALDPDVILVARSENHGGSPASIEALRGSESLAGVTAVREDAVHGVPLDDLAFGPRLGEAVLRWNGLFAESVESDRE